ncbi:MULTISPECIES: hypothetical protein [Sphingobacterium]|uniref:hypothetical protein n=1 Tax=Sphingobacterium TaxID=28453 RepID=UPI0013DC59A6|nr:MULTISPECIES: hypothetical protein [unclassified Sphingobacterium]
MKHICLISISCIIFFSCNYNTAKSFYIDELNKDTLLKFDLGYNPHGKINLHVIGEVDDSIKINNLYLAGGKIDTVFQQDWYTQDVIISYYKHKAKIGKIKISCQ